jgi:hypothetical protein
MDKHTDKHHKSIKLPKGGLSMFKFKKIGKSNPIHCSIRKWSEVIDEVMLWYKICNSDADKALIFAHAKISDTAEEIKFAGRTLFVSCNEMPQLNQIEKNTLIREIMSKYRNIFNAEFEDKENKQILKIFYHN